MSSETKITVGAELSLGGASVSVVSLRIREGLSRVTEASAEIASRTEIDAAGLRGAEATAALTVNLTPARSFSLVIGRVAFLGVDQGSLRYRVDMFSPLWLLRHTRNLRKFRNLSAKDIVSQVLSEGGVTFAWKLLREPPMRKYCVQYRESNFDFVSRLLEFEGIYYVTRDDGSLSLEDHSPAVDPIDGDSDFTLLEHAGSLEGGELGVHGFGWGSRVGTGKVTLNDFSWKAPQVPLIQSKAADRDDELELYHYPAGYRKPDQGAELAQMRLEAARARTRFARGDGNVVPFAAGRKMTFEGEEVLLVDVEHEVHDPAFRDGSDREPEESEAPAYHNRFEAIPIGVPYRPPLATRQPSIDGCHTVMVRGPEGEEIHTDRFGRFKAQFHWDREASGTDVDSRWLRKLQEGATSINLARVGWEVSVAYVDGDPDRPIGLARDINGAMVPAYGQPSNKQIMTIKTPTYPGKVGFNELKLDDRAGAQRFDVRAELDLVNRVNHDKTETIGKNETHVVDLQFKHKVQRDQKVSVGGNQKVTVAGDVNMKVDQSRTETIGGNQTLDVGKSLQVEVGANQAENVGSLRLSIVGSIKPPDVVANAKAMVPSASGAAKTVGKAAVKGARGGGGAAGAAAGAKASLASMVPSPEGAASQLTGGLSSGDLTALASGAIDRNAEKKLSRTVGAVHLAAAGDNVSVAAQYLHAEVVGGAKLTVSGDGITQSAGKAMALTVGGALFKKTAQDAGYGAKLTKVTVGGLAKLDGGERLELTSKAISLEADTKLRLESNGLAIELTPSKTSIEGNLRLEASEKVTVTGSDDNLTKG